MTRADRLIRRIRNLEAELIELEPRPYGGGNPYYYCASCERSMIEASYAGHYKGCKVVGLQKEIAYYKELLKYEDAVTLFGKG